MRPDEAFGAFPVPRPFERGTLQGWGKLGAANDPDAWVTVQGWLTNILEMRQDHPRYRRDGAKQGLVLVGPPGTGKTALASCLLNEMSRARSNCAFILDGNLAPVLRQRQRSYVDDDTEDMLDTLARIGCVVWDDLMRLGGDEAHVEWFFRSRFGNGVPTIITLNDEVRLGAVLKSFLAPFLWVPFVGKDLRKADGGG